MGFVAFLLHLLGYYVFLEKGCNVDKLRNLIKAVTVELLFLSLAFSIKKV